jgi:16S rRNA (adenine1518-N6/adenine1519-N6)-dimethyltransferase
MRPKKKFAQHWLKSDKILDQIIMASIIQPSDSILEIGPGTGILTRRLLDKAKEVISVEIDRDLCQKLIKKFHTVENFLLLQEDFLECDLGKLLETFPQFHQPNKVVANIPYNITGPILEKLLGKIANPNPNPYDLIVLLVQKEVADRLVAISKTKSFGALTVRVQYLAEADLICDVPAKAFNPPPKVDSAVIALTPRPFSLSADNPRHLETLVKLGFATKRKMLRNNLKSVIDSDELTPILESLYINPQARGEELSVLEWVKLSNKINQLNKVC